MIHVVREKVANFDPDPGHFRSTIGGRSVEWSGVEPTPAEVEAFVNPPAEVVAASKRAQAKELITGNSPLSRVLRGILKITKPGNRTAAQWRQDLIDALDADA